MKAFEFTFKNVFLKTLNLIALYAISVGLFTALILTLVTVSRFM